MKTKLCMTMVVLLAVGAFAKEETKAEDWDYRPVMSTDEVGNQQTLDSKANPLYESRLLAPVTDARDAFAEKADLT